MARKATKAKPKETAQEMEEWVPPVQPEIQPLPKADIAHIDEAAVKGEVLRIHNKKDSPRRRQIVIDTLTQGYSLQTAANRAGISRRLILIWREKDKEFDKAVSEAQEAGIDLMEDEALRRATQGVLEPIYQGGILCGYVTRYSDKLLEMNLKARRPQKYRERMDVNQTGTFTIVQSKEDDDCL